MTTTNKDRQGQYDAVVVGGGPAGLQAALSLGRLNRHVLLVDSGEYRNATVREMHNFLTHDGDDPERLRASARAELDGYDTVEVRRDAVADVGPHGDGWHVRFADGPPVRARKLVLATGLRDRLAETPGLEKLWGDVVAHCPFCHGHELRGRQVAILRAGVHAPRLAMMMRPIAERVTVLTDATELDPSVADQLVKEGVEVRTEPVTRVLRSAAGATVELAGGPDLEVGGIFVSPQQSQASSLPADLGLEMLPSGCVRIDERGRTSRPGVYAAGDMAHQPELPMPQASVLTAAAAGLMAGTAVVGDLLAEDHPWVMPT